MKNIIVLLAFGFLVACGSARSANDSSSSSDNKNVLPPDTGSNKYSKTRQ